MQLKFNLAACLLKFGSLLRKEDWHCSNPKTDDKIDFFYRFLNFLTAFNCKISKHLLYSYGDSLLRLLKEHLKDQTGARSALRLNIVSVASSRIQNTSCEGCKSFSSILSYMLSQQTCKWLN